MQIAFPAPVRLQSSVPRLEGLRLQPFTNIDGETFAKPAMNGFWRLDMQAFAFDMQSHLALSAFVTAMGAANAECVVPVYVKWRPLGGNGRMLVRGGPGAPFTSDHIGFTSPQFGGFTLRAPAAYRDSYIDVDTPALSNLSPGHFVTLGARLHQVVNVVPIDEHPQRARVSLMPNLRAAYPVGEVVVVDQLRLRCRLESGDPVASDLSPRQDTSLTFIEAF
ncbi:hypothetical protein pthi1_p40 [Paracoccus phage vB_PthS_Pthi1]|uniref:Uncharacterized protein n=1 Tax=Paracoccus thiocyanatus TaxID=34006 RepID=A0A1N6SEZ9_9RHOB|nr:hypothetical protein [Paracoccus thiocyanatus]AZV00405.1 hypothetical protein pthi1_p40 [Paracoccus phage vB_PthS_Pthi1]SIQ39532.1 hypothetical protein SAMN05421641_10784 [Paracoccus thiocyanatus]